MSTDVNGIASPGIETRYHVKLPKLPDSWVYRHFQDILDVQGGSQPPKSTFVYEPTPGYIQLLQIRDFGDRGVPTYVRKELVTKTCEEDDILIARYGASLGRLVTGQSGAYNVALAKVIFNDSHFYGRYLFYLLQTPFFQTPLHMISRSAQNGFNKGDLSDIVLPVSPLNEQRRIVGKIEELFSDLEAGVAALRRAKANLKRYRAAVLKAAVEGDLTAEWRAQHPDTEPATQLLTRILKQRRDQWEAAQLAKFQAAGKEPPKGWKARYVEPSHPDTTDLPEIPKGWTIASVDQLTTTITSGSRDWTQYYGEGTGTFIMAQNVRPGHLDLAFRQSVNPPNDDRDRVRSQVQANDLLVTIVGANTGDVCRVDAHYPEHYVCQSVALMRPVEPRAAEFMEAYFVSWDNGQRQFRRYIYGQGRPHLGFDQLRITPIILPPLNEQVEIVAIASERLSQIDAAEAAIERDLQRAGRLRQSILQQAFTGQLVPQDPTDGPACTLLERLRRDQPSPGSKSPVKSRMRKS